VNPTVTIGALFTRRISFGEALGYRLAQFLGGYAGGLMLCLLLKQSSLAEVILTGLFVLVILAVTGLVGNAGTAGVVIGLTLTVVHLIGIPLTGASVNPARSLGPALVVGGTALSQVWLFIVAPLVGGVVAAIVHAGLYPRVRPDLLVVQVCE
jgi:aquaporin Z